MHTTEQPQQTLVGRVRVLREKEYSHTYETALWHKTYTIAADQVVDLFAVKSHIPSERFRFFARAHGVCTSSNFQSLFGGVAIGTGGVNEHVGEEDDVPVFNTDGRGIVQRLHTEATGHVWYAHRASQDVQVCVDRDALTDLGIDYDAELSKALDMDKELKVRDAERQAVSLGALCLVNFNDCERVRLIEAGEELPKDLGRHQVWDLERAQSQLAHTTDSVRSSKQRLADRKAELLAQYGVRA